MKPELVISLLAVCIALFGGIPGVLKVIEWLNQKPKPRVNFQSTLLGEFVRPGEQTGIPVQVLFLTIWNAGDAPFNPRQYWMHAEVAEGGWVQFALIKDFDPKFESRIEVRKGETVDLQSFKGQVIRGAPMDCRLGFAHTGMSLAAFKRNRTRKIRFTISDVEGRKYKFAHTFPEANESQPYLGHHDGVTVAGTQPNSAHFIQTGGDLNRVKKKGDESEHQ